MKGPESIQPNNSQQDWEDLLAAEGMPAEPELLGGIETPDQKMKDIRHAFMLYLAERESGIHGAHVAARDEMRRTARERGFEPEDVEAYLDDMFIEHAVEDIQKLESRVIEIIEKLHTQGKLPHQKRLMNMITTELAAEYPYTKIELQSLIQPTVDTYLDRISLH